MSKFTKKETGPIPVSLCSCCEDKFDLDIHELHEIYRSTYRPRVVLNHNYIMTEHMVLTTHMYSALTYLLDRDLIVKLQNIIPDVFVKNSDCSSARNDAKMCRFKVTDTVADDQPVPDLCLFRSQLLRVRSYIMSSEYKLTDEEKSSTDEKSDGALLDAETFNLFLLDERLRHIVEDNAVPVRDACACPTEGLEEEDEDSTFNASDFTHSSGYDPELGYNPMDYEGYEETDDEHNEETDDDTNNAADDDTHDATNGDADPIPMTTFEGEDEKELLNSLPEFDTHFETNVEMGPTILGCNLEKPECHPETIYSPRDCCHCDLCVTRRTIEDSYVPMTPDDLENLTKLWQAFYDVQGFFEEHAYSKDLSPLQYVEKRLIEMTQKNIVSGFFEFSGLHSRTDLFECQCKSLRIATIHL